MKITQDGDIQFSAAEWVEAMNPAAKLHLLHHLAADGQVIEAAIASLMGEWFFDDVEIEEPPVGWWNTMSRELLGKVIPLMPEAAKRLIAHLLSELQKAEKEKSRTEAWAWAMYHAWPEGHDRSRPSVDRFEPGPSWQEKRLEAERLLAESEATQ